MVIPIGYQKILAKIVDTWVRDKDEWIEELEED